MFLGPGPAVTIELTIYFEEHKSTKTFVQLHTAQCLPAVPLQE